MPETHEEAAQFLMYLWGATLLMVVAGLLVLPVAVVAGFATFSGLMVIFAAIMWSK